MWREQWANYRLKPELGEVEYYYVPYHSFLFSCFIAIASIETPSSFTVVWPYTKAQPVYIKYFKFIYAQTIWKQGPPHYLNLYLFPGKKINATTLFLILPSTKMIIKKML